MKKILIFGAGKSATVLIEYLLEQASIHQWQVIVADQDIDLSLIHIFFLDDVNK